MSHDLLVVACPAFLILSIVSHGKISMQAPKNFGSRAHLENLSTIIIAKYHNAKEKEREKNRYYHISDFS